VRAVDILGWLPAFDLRSSRANDAATRHEDRTAQRIPNLYGLKKRRLTDTIAMCQQYNRTMRLILLLLCKRRLSEFHGYLACHTTYDTNASARTTNGLQFELVGQPEHTRNDEQGAGL
jgi:hypothetical protein